ncbi:AAA domain-containing protein [Actinoplanes missouriensis]|uniref:AAA domain-containing protein n=1 Tax=Actinoplanes missouriensis TaxID=1866 RepID=UPI0033EF8962
MTTSSPSHLDRAVRLFEFLARAQQSTVSAPRSYERYDTVTWARNLPRHDAVHFAHWNPEPEFGDEIGHIDRLERVAPPEPGPVLAPWLDGTIEDAAAAPGLATEIADPDVDGYDDEEDGEEPEPLLLVDHPEVERAYRSWLPRWDSWAEKERIERPVRDAYSALFAMQATAASNPEELELVLAVGCLVWKPAGHQPVRRHVLTTPVAIELDPVSGSLRIDALEGPDPLRLELDMLDSHLTNSRHITDVRAFARDYAHHPLHPGQIGELLQRIAHSLDPDGVYADAEEPARGTPDTAQVALAPAIVLRVRDHGLVQLLERIREQLIETRQVPDGVLPLVDPDHRPATETDPTPGALVAVDNDLYLPLPVNERQLQVLQQVDRHAQTLVQGPPGTGKTHTAAALLSHLLAQGKRVLVTAQTDRALKEVRAKLPEAIRPLSVAVVGASREDMADLKVAVNTISQQAIEFDDGESRRTVQGHLDAIDRLRRKRADLHRRIIDARAAEVVEHEQGAYRGTLAAVAAAHAADEHRYGWITSFLPESPAERAPLAAREAGEWLGLLRDVALTADDPASRDVLADPAQLTPPAAFAAAVAAESRARATFDAHAGHREHAAFAAVRTLPPAERNRLREHLHRLADTADELARRRETWMSEALTDVVSGRGQIWQRRAQQIQELADQAHPLVGFLGVAEIAVTGPELAPMVALARHLRQHLETGAKIKLAADGSPVLGMLTHKAVKAARDLFTGVRVDGRPPTSVQAIDHFLAWAEATRLLGALDRAWPSTVIVPPEDTLHERLVWHVTELSQLQRVLALGQLLAQQEQYLAQLRLPRPEWTDLSAVRAYATLVDAATAEDELRFARASVDSAALPVSALAHEPAAAPALMALAKAITDRDVDAYAVAVHRIVRLTEVRALAGRRDDLGARLRQSAPDLHDAMRSSIADQRWDERLPGWDGAWAWGVTRAWLAARQITDLNRLQQRIGEVEQRIRHHVEELAAARAWRHAASPERISGSARANLQQYGQLVRRLGKGTGKYAAQRRGEIRQAMDRCRPSVPVWIMPIYRIAEQLQVQPDMFDVVVVDEASQAGLAATFLQYLAPKIVVIGDDKQVSPSAVGVDQQHLRNLAAQYLYDDPYRASWQDPQRSLFDEAKMRFSGLIPLVEHRRCVPEIINFSNRIAYEPENIRLIPVRQYGADRLEPIKPVLVEGGYVRGTTYKTNPPEAEAIADRIVACAEDPRYDGLTFGVISLQGVHQAKLIERLLLERLDPAQWESRELRCGDSADFQGSERDVMFLSMVTAVEPGVRIGSATTDMYVQRYNVAASRAKDQMWVFHSVRPSDLGNPQDMRYQMLDYCYGVAARPAEHDGVVLPVDVPENERVAPFDSLFEQRVYNRLVARGFTVVPQYEAIGYRIDLVVVGPHSRLAVECDGDAWHGPDRYEADMARQRELERCGWEFFRIPQSAFVVDEASVLRDLWAALERRGIRPSDWAEQVTSTIPRPEPAPETRIVESVPAPDPEPEPESESEPAPVASLRPYRIYQGEAPRPASPTPPGMREALIAIVACEGPMVGTRLQTAYVRAAGGQRVTRLTASAVNKVITSAVRRGLLVESNPLGEAGIQPRTYRLPEQPETVLRELGPRGLDEMPPAELAVVMAGHAETLGWARPDLVYRATLQTYGRKLVTEVAAARLAKVARLIRD